jgi:hypothetical protein
MELNVTFSHDSNLEATTLATLSNIFRVLYVGNPCELAGVRRTVEMAVEKGKRKQ